MASASPRPADRATIVDECFWIGLAISILALGPLLATVALVRVARMHRRLEDLGQELRRTLRELHALREATGAPPAHAGPTPPGPPAAPAAAPATPVRAPAAEAPRAAAPPTAVPIPPPMPPPLPAAPAPAPAEPLPRPPATPARPKESLESAIGSRWLVRVGAGALFLGVAFLLKYSFDQGWLGPLPRLLGGAAAGLVLWALGWHWRGRYAALAQGLFAAGSGLLYLVAWAARAVFDLIGHGPAFAAMLAVTAATLHAAHAMRALVPAVMGLCGGFLTPLLLGGEAEAPHALFGYAALLSAAAMLLRWRHGWWVLAPLCTAGSTALVAAFTSQAGTDAAGAIALDGTVLLLVLLASGPMQGSLRARRLHAADLSAAGGAAVLCWLLLWHLKPDLAPPLPLLCTLVGAATLAFAALLHRQRVPDDRVGREGLWFPAAAMVALAAAFPLEQRGLVLALCLIALLQVHAGARLGSLAVQAAAIASVGWAVGLTAQHLPPELEQAARLVLGEPSLLPLSQGSDWVDLGVVGTLLALAWLLPAARAILAAAAGLLAVPLVARELLGWFIPAHFPHQWFAFDIRLAWALPLAGLAVAAARATALPLRVVAAGAGLGTVLLLLGLFPIGVERDAGALRIAQFGGMAAVTLLLLLAARRAGTADDVSPRTALVLGGMAAALVHFLATLETLRGLPEGTFGGGPGRLLLGTAALLLAWLPGARRGRVPAAVWSTAAPLLVAPLMFAADQAMTGTDGAPALTMPVAAAWAGTALALLVRGGPADAGTLLCTGLALAAAIAGIPWLQQPQALPLLNTSCGALLSAPVLLLVAPGGELRRAAAWLAVLVLASGETWRWAVLAAAEHGWGDRAGHVALSLTWTAWAAGSLAVGVLLQNSRLRLLALSLFAVTLVKAALFDLAELPTPLRILSFLGLGLALMAGGWLYHRFAARIGGGPPATAP